eukprot:15062992-Alexandrium_andersonii.AAC.1
MLDSVLVLGQRAGVGVGLWKNDSGKWDADASRNKSATDAPADMRCQSPPVRVHRQHHGMIQLAFR